MKQWLVFVGVGWLVVACSVEPTPSATITPRPTIEPRTPPTAIPTAVDAGRLVLGQAQTITLPGQTYTTLQYDAPQTQTVTITVQALSDDGAGNPLDLVLEVLDERQNRVAYNDDQLTALPELAFADAALVDLTLPAGTYTVRVNAFNGFQGGQVEVLIVES